MQRRPTLIRALVLASFFVVAALQAWPLPKDLSGSLTGNPGGDTGVYVWNTWVFRHELMERHRSPFQTDRILPLHGPVDLSLHNYTVFADVVAVPLQPWLGVVATFNIVYLANVALCGIGMCLLARRLRRVVPIGNSEAWLAGLLFACSPFLVARSTAHFSLAAAAPLPFFALWLDRAWESRRKRDAAGAGACLAWAAFSDPYYAVYCVLLGFAIVAAKVVDIRFTRRLAAGSMRGRRVLDGFIAALTVAILGLRLFNVRAFTLGSTVVSIQSLYTPILLITVLCLVRLAMTFRAAVTWSRPMGLSKLVAAGVTLGLVASALMAPELYAVALRIIDGRTVTGPVLWRSSAPGVDLVSFFLPNPNHPWAPRALVEWVTAEPGRYEENVVSLPWVAVLVIGAAWRWAGERPNRLWTTITLAAAALALGPFLRIAGLETYVPTPWALVRYLPVVGDAHDDDDAETSGHAGVAMLFAAGLAALRQRFPTHRRGLTMAVGGLLMLELLPAPRELFPARIPSVYDVVAQDERDIRVLELPFGIRDGLSSLGNFSAASQLYQTRHAKTLIGGYLSRVPQTQKDAALANPYLLAMMHASEGRRLEGAVRDAAAAASAQFIAETRLGYVVIDQGRVTPDLIQFVIDTLKLQPIATDGTYHLYAPAPR